MTAEGLHAFELRKDHKSGIYSHEKTPQPLHPTYENEFKKNTIAWNFFQSQAPSYIKVMTHWIMSAKQEKTRLARLEKTIAISEKQERMT